MSDPTNLPRDSRGYSATRLGSSVDFTTKAPVFSSTQPFELTLVLGLFVDLFTDYFHMVWGFGVAAGKCSRPAPATREGVR